MKRFRPSFILWVILASGVMGFALLFGFPAAYGASEVQTAGAGLVSRVAPGEFLPVSVKLLNFGSQKEVDVSVIYQIVNPQDKEIYHSEETVAVQTTASFIKTIQIPFDVPPGQYIAKSSITYKGQAAPATTEFPFVVERKVFGLFQSEFYLYLASLLFAAIMVGFVVHGWAKAHRASRIAPIDYSRVPRSERMFYELISDTIAHIREHAGDAALDIAKSIAGLTIDESSGKVLAIRENPAKVMALLIQKYEQSLGRKVSFELQKPGNKGRPEPALTDKRFTIISNS